MFKIDSYNNRSTENKVVVDRQKNTKEKDSDKSVISKKKLEDNISISEESRKLLEEKKAALDREAEEKLSMIERFKEELEAAEKAGNPYDDMLKCLKIAMRIMKGDRVPDRDMNYLAEHQPEMFSAAIMFRSNNENPKNHKSLLEEPENKLMEAFTSDLEEIIDNELEKAQEIMEK